MERSKRVGIAGASGLSFFAQLGDALVQPREDRGDIRTSQFARSLRSGAGLVRCVCACDAETCSLRFMSLSSFFTT
jgi:hypothetical protein